jgi:precorrin isomerase
MPFSRRGVPKNGTVSEVQQASPVRFQLRFMTGHSHELKSNGQIFTDAEMLAATQHWKDIRQWSNVVN